MEKIGIIMNGVTGRMGTNQHLERSIVAIRRQGGLQLHDGRWIMPDPILVGRNRQKLESLAYKYEVERWSENLDECLADPHNAIYFDAQTTQMRPAAIRRAIAAGKHVYCEKPIGGSFDESMELARLATRAGVKHGIVQDKLFLPGLLKLREVLKSGALGRILSVRGEFGYWVFEDGSVALQRPSWNYRKEDGGGIILDMFPHWQYLIENLFSPITGVFCVSAIHIPRRLDESGASYPVTADDSAYATFQLQNGVIVQMNSSWCTRVHRDELLTLHVDGEQGSAVAGLRECSVQLRAETPRAVWNPEIADPNHYLESWRKVPDSELVGNAFKVQWEMFLRHVLENASFPHDFLQAARGMQVVEAGLRSCQDKNWQQIPMIPTEF